MDSLQFQILLLSQSTMTLSTHLLNFKLLFEFRFYILFYIITSLFLQVVFGGKAIQIIDYLLKLLTNCLTVV